MPDTATPIQPPTLKFSDLAGLASGPPPATAKTLTLSDLSGLAKTPGPAQSDDDIIRQYGYDPKVVKTSHFYVPGHLLSAASDNAPHDEGILGNAAKGLDEVGNGVYDIPAGLFQLAMHGANKLGIASDADTQYNDLLEKVHHQAYISRVGADHSILPELAGSMLVPVPGGAATKLLERAGILAKAAEGTAPTIARTVASGAETGALASAAQPVISGDADSFAGNKAAQIATGAAMGAATGGLIHGTGSAVAKGLNYRTTKLPEEIANDLQAKADASAADAKSAADTATMRIAQEKAATQAAQDEAAGRTLQATAATKTATDAARQPVADAVAEGQQATAALAAQKAAQTKASQVSQDAANTTAANTTADLGNNASLATSRLRDAMSAMPYHGSDGIIEAANSDDPAVSGSAGKVLRLIQDAGDNPDKIQKASVAARIWKAKQTANSLYGAVADMARKVAPRDIPLTETEGVLSSALDKARASKLPDTGLLKTLSTIQDNIGAGDSDEVADNSYANMRQFDDDLGALIRSGQKGTNALVSDTHIPVLMSVRNALRADMDRFTQSVPELRDAANAADQYYKTNVIPFKQPDIAATGSAVDPDQIYDSMVKAGAGDKAQRYYDALDQKGRAAVRYQMSLDALNHATDPDRGTIDPEKFTDALRKVEAAHGVFFSGSDKAEQDGLKTIAQQAIRDQDTAKIAGANTSAERQRLVDAAQQRVADARAAVQQARAARSSNTAQLQRELADETARYQATAADVARTSSGRQMIHQAAADNVQLGADADKAAAIAQKKTADASKGKSALALLGMGTAGAGGAELVASLLHVPGAGLLGGGIAATSALKFLTQTPAGRRYLQSASTMKAGTPAMRNLIDTITKQAAAATARATTQDNPQ